MKVVKILENIETKAEVAFLTHFGRWTEMDLGQQQLATHIDAARSIRDEAVAAGHNEGVKEQERNLLFEQLRKCGVEPTPEQEQLLELDTDLNAMGISFAAEKIRKKAIKP